MVTLAIVLQRCTMHARASPDVFCGAVQELHNCLGPVVEKGDLFNVEKEIWDGLGRTLWLPLPEKESFH